jgi:hypothetical protein
MTIEPTKKKFQDYKKMMISMLNLEKTKWKKLIDFIFKTILLFSIIFIHSKKHIKIYLLCICLFIFYKHISAILFVNLILYTN